MFRKYCAVIAMAMALATVAVSSCKKQQDTDTTVNAPVIGAEQWNEKSGGGREDDDKPIIQHRSVSSTFQPVAGADVTVIVGHDTLHAVSDSQGILVFRMPAFGSCRVKVNHPDYQPSDSLFTIADAITVKTSVLQEQ